MIDLRFKQLTFSDKTALLLEKGSIVVFVGPNNAGKSEAIRNLAQAIARPVEGPVVTNVEFEQSGDQEAFGEWLNVNTRHSKREDGVEMVHRVGSQQQRNVVMNQWQQGPPFQHIAPLVSIVAMAEERLSLVKEVASIAVRSEHPSNALQYLYLNPDAEQSLAETIREAFGTGIVVDRTGGSRIYLLYGEPPVEPATLPPTKAFLDEVSALSPVDSQGDGVKSFTGLMLATATGVYPMVLIDEPEAFLHPPQAKLLGRKLAEGANSETQVVLATHSSDVLQGLIEADPDHVNVVRITRDGDVNPISVLAPDQLAELWSDPILKYSNILDGLFHDRVVVCEADGDCRFFSAATDEMQRSGTAGERQEVMFTHAGGKARLHSIAAALRAVSVPVSVVADIDILRQPTDVKRILKALKADWSLVESACNSIKKTVDGLPSETLVQELRGSFENVFGDKNPKDRALHEDAARARKQLKVVDGWSRLKKAGSAAMPNGEPRKQLNLLLDKLAAMGLHIVPVGELESFAPEVGGHGPSWAVAALEKKVHEDPDNPVRAFLDRVLTS